MPPKFKKTFSFEDVRVIRSEETAVVSERAQRKQKLPEMIFLVLRTLEDLLGHRSGSDDDFILQGPSSQPTPVHHENDKIKAVRAQVAEVTQVMQANLGKVLARGDRLEDLQEASERLNIATADFHVAATRVRRRAWMQHLKMRALLVGVIALVLIGITVPIIVHFSSDSPQQAS